MIIAVLASLIAFAVSSGHSTFAVSQSRQDPGCIEWQACSAMALAAADRGEYETFHDLAWRAVQTGPPRDAALMYLLARAQVLSGRPHDALVMLDRLAGMGVASDAAANDDFIRARQLPGWPDVAARIERLRAAASPAAAVPVAGAPVAAPVAALPVAAPVAAPPVATPVTARRAAVPEAAPPVAPPVAARPAVPRARAPRAPSEDGPATAAPSVPMPAPRAEAVRFSTDRFTVVGLAYDAVSRRILFGDRLGRKLVVVSEGSNQPLDLVRADSAGFHDIAAVDIDGTRGDLWVASTAAADGAGTLHRLQLVSGRPLNAFRIAPDAVPANLVDLAITHGGTVLVLDAASGRILALRPGAPSLKTVVRIVVTDPVSLAVGSDESIAYVAHGDGVSRIDMRLRTATPVVSPKGVSLARLQQIRWYRNALIGVAVEEGSSRILRFDLDATGRAVKRATTIEASAAIAGQACVAISGDDLLYLAPGAASNAGSASAAAPVVATELVAYRVHLR